MNADRGQKPVAKGHFSKTPFAHILIYLFEHKMSGTLTVSDYAHDVSIYFLDGIPAKVKSNIAGKELGRILCDLELITEKQLENCREVMKRTGGLQGEILIRQKAIDAKNLVRGLKEQMLIKLSDVFGMTDATYAFYDKTNFLVTYGSGELFPLSPFPVVMNGLRIKGTDLNLDPILDKLKDKWLSLPNVEPLRRFRLSQGERQLCLELLNNKRTYDELIASGRFTEQLVRYTLYALFICKQLQTWDAPPSSPPKDDAPRVRMEHFDTIPPPKEKKSDDPDVAALKEEIKAVAGSISTQSYYQMLGLQFGAPPEEARKAFFRLAKKFHPDRVAGTSAADMKDTLQYIFSNLSQAHSTLIDPETRDEYDAAIREGQKRTSLTPKPADEAEVRETLEAENLHQMALVFMRRSQYTEATELIERVRLLNPKEGEYLATWAYLQAHTRPKGARIDDLIERLREALKSNPNSERILLYLAKLLDRVGHQTEAATFYRRVVRQNPKNVEAARMVRLLKMRARKEQEKAKAGFLKRFLSEKD